MLDTVEVLSHRKFRDLLTDAGTLLEAFFTERHPTQLVAPDDRSLAGASDADVLEAAAGSTRLGVMVGGTAVASGPLDGYASSARSLTWPAVCCPDVRLGPGSDRRHPSLGHETPLDLIAQGRHQRVADVLNSLAEEVTP
jgi:hypothetical protein